MERQMERQNTDQNYKPDLGTKIPRPDWPWRSAFQESGKSAYAKASMPKRENQKI
jgi:hypothetical protein